MWHRLAAVFRRAFRLLAFVCIGVVAVAGLYWGWTAYEDARIEKVVSKTHEWPVETLPGVPFKTTLKTRCEKSTLYYVLTVEPAETLGASKRDGGRVTRPIAAFLAAAASDWSAEFLQSVKALNIALSDPDGFERVAFDVESAAMHRRVADDATTGDFRANASTSCDKHAYLRATKHSVGWTPAR
jgi:hypothetical protein